MNNFIVSHILHSLILHTINFIEMWSSCVIVVIYILQASGLSLSVPKEIISFCACLHIYRWKSGAHCTYFRFGHQHITLNMVCTFFFFAQVKCIPFFVFVLLTQLCVLCVCVRYWSIMCCTQLFSLAFTMVSISLADIFIFWGNFSIILHDAKRKRNEWIEKQQKSLALRRFVVSVLNNS